jgi:hypothetical protein
MRAIQTQAMDSAEAPQNRADQAAGRFTTTVENSLAAAGRPVSLDGIVRSMHARAGARSRATNQAWTAEQQKSLQRRIAMAGFGAQRAALAQGQGEIGVGMGAATRQAADQRDATMSAAYSNALGTVAGGFGTWAANRAATNSLNNQIIQQNMVRLQPQMNATLNSIPYSPPKVTYPSGGAVLPPKG